MEPKKILVLVIAYEGEKTIVGVLDSIRETYWNDAEEILLIDDASPKPDKTYQIAMAYKKRHMLSKLTVKKNLRNQGYGGNQKIGFNYAIKKGYDIIAIIHGDGQYSPKYLPELVKPLVDDKFDLMFGNRITGNPLKGVMPMWKFIGNRFLTLIENFLLGQSLSEYHSGLRAYSCSSLNVIPFNLISNDFVFDTDIIIQYFHQGLRIGEIEISTHYDENSHVIHFKQGVEVGINILKSVFSYRFVRPRQKKFDF